MKTVYKIINKIAFNLFQKQEAELNLLKGKIYSDGSESLLSQLYAADNETLFI